MKVIGLAGWSGAGKTTLLARVIPYFRQQGLRVSVIKHAHHSLAQSSTIAGQGSWVYRQAGAEEVLVSSANRWALMHELRGMPEPRLPQLLRRLSDVDLVVVEGFKSEPHRKIEVYRQGQRQDAANFPDRSRHCRHAATDTAVDTTLPVAHLDDIPALCRSHDEKPHAISLEEVLAASVSEA